MKLALIQIAIIIVLVNGEASNEYFLKIGTYSNNGNSKDFFLSRYHEMTWMNAYASCLNHRMELVRLESEEKANTFVRAVKLNCLKFGDRLFFDGEGFYNATSIPSSSENGDRCIYLYKSLDESSLTPKFGFQDCVTSTRINKFVCQKDSTDFSDETNTFGPWKVDVNSRIFVPLGNTSAFFESQVHRTTYFMNTKGIQTFSDAAKICRSFGLNLANLRNKDVFDSLIDLIKKKYIPGWYDTYYIGGMRESLSSDLTQDHLSDSGDCQALFWIREKNKIGIRNVDCSQESGYSICEKLEVLQPWDNAYVEKNYVEPLPLFTKKMLYLGDVSANENDQASSKRSIYINFTKTWLNHFDALSFCKSFGMDLYSPESNEANQQVFGLLKAKGNFSDIAIGGTKIGTECFWYSTKSGVEITAEIAVTGNDGGDFLSLRLIDNDYKFVKAQFIDKHFLCEVDL